MSDINHKKCPYLDCSSSDAFSFNLEKGVGKCHSCGESYPKKGMRGNLHEWATTEYKLKDRSGKYVSKADTYDGDLSGLDYWAEFDESMEVAEQQEEEYEMIEEKPNVDLSKLEVIKVPRRNIMTVTQDFYGVKVYGVDGVPIRDTYPYPSGGIKTRHIVDKGFSVTGSINELFGMNLFAPSSSKMVTICEGELDAMSAYQMLKNGAYVNPVVSVPSATPSNKMWENSREWLDSFEKIVLSVDNDKAGNNLVDIIFELFPSKTYRVNHGNHKDANDFLQAGEGAAYKSAWWAAKKVTPEGFISSGEDWKDCLHKETPYQYVPTPIKGLNGVIRGWTKGGITILKALPGTGKSSIFRWAQHDLVVNKGISAASLMMEEQKSTTIRGMLTYELGVNVNTREDAERNGFTDDKLDEFIDKVTEDDKFVCFDIDTKDAVESTIKAINTAISLYGSEYIFIDHIQRLAYHAGVDGATASLTKLGVEMAEVAKRRNVGIICISHVNGDGKTKYAAAIEEEAIQIIELTRDLEADSEEERNKTQLIVTKNRPFANAGKAGELTYDFETTMVSEKVFIRLEAKQTKGEW